MVSPPQKRRAAKSVVDAQRPPMPGTVQLERAIIELSHAHSRYGYRRVHAVLPRQGLHCALRTGQRVRRRAGLQITGPAMRPKTPPIYVESLRWLGPPTA